MDFCREVEEQGRLQRPVDDEARITFDILGVPPVIVNAMAVECERGVTEEENRCWFDTSLVTSRLSGLRRGLLSGRQEIAIDEVLTLTNEFPSVGLDQVINSHEAEAAGAAFLGRDIRDPGNAPKAIADPQIALETHHAAGPHAPRKHHGREKTATPGMPVFRQSSSGRRGLRKTQVKQARRDVAGLCRSLREIEGCLEPSNKIGGDDIRTCLLPADPGSETLDVEILRLSRQGSPFLRPSERAASDECSARERRHKYAALQR
jgi:hypothetical protein